METHSDAVLRVLAARKQQLPPTTSEEQGDLDTAVDAALACLSGHASSSTQSSQASTALDILVKAAEAHKLVKSQFAQEQQPALAGVIYEHWTSPELSYGARSLLDASLSLSLSADDSRLEATTPFLRALLESLQAGFTSSGSGSKRPLQILALAFDAVPREALAEHFPNLWDRLAHALAEHSGALQAAKIMIKLGRDMPLPQLGEKLLPLLVSEAAAGRQAVFETLLPGLLAHPHRGPQLLVDLSAALPPTERLAQLSLLRAGATAGISPAPSASAGAEALIGGSLTHADPIIRFEALRLLALLPVGNKPSQPIPAAHLELQATFWRYNLSDSDSASVRTGLVGAWKEFIGRCRTSAGAAQKAAKRLAPPQSSSAAAGPGEKYVRDVQAFFEQWSGMAVECLREDKPYRCQMNALRFLEILLGEGIDPDYAPAAAAAAVSLSSGRGKARTTSQSWPFAISMVSRGDFIHRALACVTATYEDVKSTAFALLSRCALPAGLAARMRSYALSLLGQQRDADVSSGILLLRLVLLQQQRNNAAEAEAEAGGTQRLVVMRELLESLAGRIEQAELLAQSETAESGSCLPAPLHGYVSAINRILLDAPTVLSTAPDLADALYPVIDRIWALTRPVLCKDELDADDAGADDKGDVVSAAWRAMRDAGDLLSTLLVLSAAGQSEQLKKRGRIFEIWLLQVEHRGAFAHISNAYGRVTAALRRPGKSQAALPSAWLESHLDAILLCAIPTKRRSAGLPYLILGSLSGAQTGSRDLSICFDRLFAAVAPSSTLPAATQSHAINILRVLFLDGKLGSAVKPFVERAFVVAVEGFGATDWHVRNASLLLYAALIQREFGTKREHLPLARRPSLFDFFSRFSSLLPLLLSELGRASSGEAAAEGLGSVFSVLLLLSLLQSPSADSHWSRPFETYVEKCRKSKVWKVREAAAAALTGLVPPSRTWTTCGAILTTIQEEGDTNALHGSLLQLLALVKTASIPAPESFWQDASAALEPFVTSAYPLAIRTEAARIANLAPSSSISPTFTTTLLSLAGPELAARPYKRPCEDSWQRALAVALLRAEPACASDLLRANAQTRNEALVHLVQSGAVPDDEASSSLSALLLRSEAAADLENTALAASVLAKLPESALQSVEYGAILAVHRASPIPLLSEALLPLLAKLGHGEAVLSDLRADLADLASSESASARLSAAKALWNLPLDALDTFECTKLLLDLLQDEDIGVRQLANAAASRLVSGDGEEEQTAKTTEVLWARLAASIIAENASELVREALDRAEDLLDASEAQDVVLFAVEKINVYIDPSVNIQGTAGALRTLQRENLDTPELREMYERCKQKSQLATKAQKAAGTLCASAALVEAEAWLAAIQPVFD